jgi:Transposase, Mutator family
LKHLGPCAHACDYQERDLSGTDFVHLWVDGIHLKVRLEREKLCLLVMIGVRADGRKELVALTDGYRESTESWAELLRGCRRRGMTAPVLAVGDGPSDSGRRCAWCSPKLVSSVAGSTSKPMCLPRRQSQRTPVRWRRSRKSTTPKTSTRRRSRSRRSNSTMARSTPRRSQDH